MVDQQEKMEKERSINIRMITDPEEYRTPISELKLVKNKQKTERIIASMKNIPEQVNQRNAILDEIQIVDLT